MRPRLVPPVLATVALLAGCGAASTKAPTACLTGPGTYAKALEAAPDPVRMAGTVPISECLTDSQSAAQIVTVGGALVATATRLNIEARSATPETAGVQLGYLLGAAAKGSAGTSGIHADLIRRLDSAAKFNAGKPLKPAFRDALAKGYAAGRANG